MAEDYRPRPSGGSNTGLIVGIVLAIVLLPLVCCGVGGVSFFFLRSSAQMQQPAPTMMIEETEPAIDLDAPAQIPLPSDTPETAPPVKEPDSN